MPEKEMLFDLYFNQKLSPEFIAVKYGVSGRTVRNWMKKHDFPRLGANHLRLGVSAHWNIGLKRSEEHIQKCREKNIGRIPYNYGKGRLKFNCIICDKDVFDKPYRKRHTCSVKCRNEFLKIGGEKHWNFNKNITNNQRARNWKKSKDWSYFVKKRDNYTCLKCGLKSEENIAHHIHNWADYPSIRFDVSNGACLCSNCHFDFHQSFGKRKTNIIMFNLWLKRKGS